MPIWISHVCDRLVASCMTASPCEFGQVSILAIVAVWVVSRRLQ